MTAPTGRMPTPKASGVRSASMVRMKSASVSMAIAIAWKIRCYASSAWDAISVHRYGSAVTRRCTGETRTGALWLQDAWKIVPGPQADARRAARRPGARSMASTSTRRRPTCAGVHHQSTAVSKHQPGTELDEFLAKGLAVVRSRTRIGTSRPISVRPIAIRPSPSCIRTLRSAALRPSPTRSRAGTGFHRRIERRAEVERLAGCG